MTVAACSYSSSAVWHDYKDLERTVLSGSASALARSLDKHRKNFTEPLNNLQQNAAKKQQIMAGTTTPIETDEGPKNLPKSLIDEVLILSELYQLDEHKTLELLWAAENRLPQFPGLTRGLVCVLLYWDGRLSLTSALRNVCQMCIGMVNTNPGIEHIANQFHNIIFDDQIVKNLMEAYASLSIEGDLDKLAKQRGLGDVRHRRNIRQLITGVKEAIADSIFFLSYHPRFDTSAILEVLKYISSIELEGNASLSSSDTKILFAAINALSVELKDEMDSLTDVPLLSEHDRLTKLHQFIYTNGNFKSKSLLGMVQFTWSITLRSLSQLPGMTVSSAQLTEFDDSCLDMALDNKIFDFFGTLFETKAINIDQELMVQQSHKLVTDLIILMPLKIKELRKMSDPSHWISLAKLITKLYGSTAKLNLHNEFWLAIINQKTTHRSLALHDFLRIDMLQMQLYVTTVNMIRALSVGEDCSSAAFKLLRQASGNLTWDRIFDSLRQYCDSLRVEVGQNVSGSGMSPEESEAMVAVIELVGTVCKHDANARQVILEQNIWRAPLYLMQMLRCPIEPVLKAACINTLSSLIGTDESASSLWVSLDADGILVGMKQELEVTEAPAERYPLTISFCKLLKHLCTFPLPLTLGAGNKATAGVGEFVEYILNHILLRIDAFSFKLPVEKWTLAIHSLDIIKLILESYVPSADDFTAGNSGIHPGFQLSKLFMTDSPFFRKLLHIIEVTVEHLEQFPLNHDDEMIKAGEGALKLITMALDGSGAYINACRDAGAGLLLTPTHQLLRSINPRTNRADYVSNITKLVRHAASHPQLTMSGLHILRYLATKFSDHELLSLTISGPSTQRDELLRGFWECLELSDPGSSDCRLQLLRLMLQNVDSISVSLSHFLLGYPLQSSLASASLQDPGVLNSPKTVFHSLLEILSFKSVRNESPELVELGFELIYRLCANTETSAPALRYLRSSHDFVNRQLIELETPSSGIDAQFLRTTGWLLKLSALELHVTSISRQRSNTARLVQLIFQRGGMKNLASDANGSVMQNTTIGELTALGADDSNVLKVLEIFRMLDLNQTFPDPPNTDLLDINVVENLAKKASEDNIVNLVYLHNLLRHELGPQIDQTGNASQPKLEAEVEDVLRWLQRANSQHKLTKAKLLFLQGWRQLVEICLAGPIELLPPAVRASLLQELLQDMLHNIRQQDASAQLTSTLSTVALALMTHLRIALKQQQEPDVRNDQNGITLLDGSVLDMSSMGMLPSTTLLPSIGEGLIEWAVGARYNQRVRAHLYGALLNYLQMQPDFYVNKDMEASRLDTMNESIMNNSRVNGNNRQMNVSAARILSQYGTSIMSVTCQDAVDGHSVTRTLAFALLDAVMRRDTDKKWLNFMREKGYLKHIISSIALEDNALIESLSGSANRMAFVYVHESRMALLNTLARTRHGSRALIEAGLMTKLASCKFIDSRPVPSAMGGESDSESDTTRLHRYRLLLFPVLRLVMGLQSTLGGNNANLQQLTLHFVLNHLDGFSAPLFSNRAEPPTDTESLEEVHLITSVLCIIAGHDFAVSGVSDMPEIALRQVNLQQNKIQRFLFSLMSNYILSENWINRAGQSSYLEAQRTSTNIIQTARQIILNSCYKNDKTGSPVIFSTNLSAETIHGNEDPPLGLVIKLLKEHTHNFTETIQARSSQQRKMDNVNGLPTVTLDELAGVADMSDVERPSLHEKQKLAKATLTRDIDLSDKLLHVQHKQLESILFILWRHIEYYLNTAPNKPKGILFGGSDGDIPDHSLSRKELNELRIGLSTVLNDTVLKRLTDAETQYYQLKGDNADHTIRDFIQPVAYRLNKVIELSQK